MQCHAAHRASALVGIRPISNQEPTVLFVEYIRSKSELGIWFDLTLPETYFRTAWFVLWKWPLSPASIQKDCRKKKSTVYPGQEDTGFDKIALSYCVLQKFQINLKARYLQTSMYSLNSISGFGMRFYMYMIGLRSVSLKVNRMCKPKLLRLQF